MIGGVVGRRYAKALLNLAGEEKQIEKVQEEILEVAATFKDSQALRDIMADPIHSLKQKENLISEIVKKLGSSELVNKFCRFLTAKNRFVLINEIATSYHVQASDMLGKATAEVTVAKKLSESEAQKLQKKLSEFTGKDISLNVKEDASILGGAITSIGSLVLDGSVRNRLNLIRETISKVN
ncbi:MAG: ATP synthase F1 subunit delta [SAR324 cluster bacterium]|uniref:ATP synthase subunit delta n=1 Tax=SAR324 cluster bacterium TaxID=2024889 RepID=A0A2A4T448_9DELT|nr:MAG: ATP synthase F1 subunit delta [SAR324 cluster bacterium]